jgi:uncharacterized protein YkwD
MFLAAAPASLRAAQSARPPEDPAPGAAACLDAVEDRILNLVNAERSGRRLPLVRPEATLRAIARNHDEDMLARRFFSHVNLFGEGPSDRIERQHRRLIGIAGENIWESSGEFASRHPDLGAEIMKAWMASPGHRENILRAEFTNLGVGVCAAGSEIRATQDFALVQALLRTPLPASAGPGWTVDLSNDGKNFAGLFDIYSKAKRAAFMSPTPISGARLDAPPGLYVLRFYFERARDRYTIYEGPSIEIR